MEGDEFKDSVMAVNSIDVKLFCDHYWSEIMKRLKRGILFLDPDIYRVLHFNGGLGRLFEEGKIRGLKQFSSFNYGDPEDKKGVFILSSPLLGLCVDILKEIINGSSFEYIQIITTVSPSIHSSENGENAHEVGTTVLKDLEEKVLEWMGDYNFTCEIFHYPLVCAPLSKDFFLTPVFDGLSPLHFDFGLNDSESKEEGVFLWSKLTQDTKLSIRRFASFWMSFLGMYGVKPDVFTVGGLSSLIGDHLNIRLSSKSPSNPNVPENKVSLLFLDRTLDLFSILREDGEETALDCILNNLDPYPGTKEDVSVNMSELFNSSEDFSLCPPGCLADQSSYDLFDALLKSPTESQEIFKRHLKRIVRTMEKEKDVEESTLAEEFISVIRSLPQDIDSLDAQDSRIIRDIQENCEWDSEGLSPLLAQFKLRNKEINENVELLQKSFALRNATIKSQAMKKRGERISQIQRTLLKDLSSKFPENVFESLIQVVKNESEPLTLDDILGLLIFTYSRIPVDSMDKDPEATDELESLISDRFLLNRGQDDESPLNELGAHKIVKTFFGKCIRANGGTSSTLRKANFSRPYVELLLNDIYCDGHEEVPHLQYKSRGTLGGRLIKSGLSFLGLSVKNKKIHPRENPIILIFIVGGITPEETKRIRLILESKKAKAQFILASNILLHSKSLVSQFLLPDATH